MVLNSEDLQKDLNVTLSEIKLMKSWRDLYSFLSGKRVESERTRVTSRNTLATSYESMHYRTLASMQAMQDSSCEARKRAFSFWGELNELAKSNAFTLNDTKSQRMQESKKRLQDYLASVRKKQQKEQRKYRMLQASQQKVDRARGDRSCKVTRFVTTNFSV